ncbi:MAG: DNA replication and repair protein RecF [Ignavibacteria bacterium]|nr:DNA replication and repair protein RecF [Bacteroidota bacterium]MBL7128036.1 DNA replication and repair protein RecF [Ignavibacteria bacterium]
MILKKIILRDFRNYEEQELDFNGKFNYVYGDNGQGKTNILEAISFISFGKSFLGASEHDCVKFGKEEFQIEGEYENDLQNVFHVFLNYNSTIKKKTFHVNKEKVTRYSSDIFGKFPVVYLSPQSLNLTYGNPSERRKFFDILISQTNRLYLDFLKDLGKLIRQKNALLKNNLYFNAYTGNELSDLLCSYNEKFVEISSNIIFRRLIFLIEFRSFFEKNFGFLITNNDKASMSYYSELFGEIDFERLGEYDKDMITKTLSNSLDQRMNEEIDRGLTLIGPQRDDYIFRLMKNDEQAAENKSGFELKIYASQGEHKTFVIALKLAEYYYLKEKKATNPILLLDDLLSELDSNRVSKIISHLKDYGQIFLTTTDIKYKSSIEKFYDDNEISTYKVLNGCVPVN